MASARGTRSSHFGKRRAAGMGVAACALCGALGVAWAPVRVAAAEEQSTAARLFEEGRVALEQNKLNEACAKLAESQQLEPRVGTLLNLADCEERRGQLLAASDHWVAAQDLARTAGDARNAEAKRRFAALETRIPRLTLRRAAGAPTSTTVKRARVGGPATQARADGRPERVDPGEYRVTVSAPGRGERAYELELMAGETATLVVDAGVVLTGSAADAQAADGGDDSPTHSWSGLDTAGAVVGGLGLVSLVAGAVLGAQAMAKQKASNDDDHCSADNLCDQQGVDLRDEAIVAARASTGTIVVGSLLVAAGIVLVAVPGQDEGASSNPRGPERNSAEPQVALRLGPTGLVVAGRW